MRRLLMVTAVWGEWHLMVLLTVNLPTLLAPGNLPTLAKCFRVRYLIYTHKSDFDRIDNDPAIAKIRNLGIDVEIEILPPDVRRNPNATQHPAWKMAVLRAREDGDLLLLIPPDVAWGGTSFRYIATRLERGERAIFMTYLRTEADSFIRALVDRKSANSFEIDIAQREMVELGVRSFHPLMGASLRDSDFFPIHPEMILWAVPGEGFAVRVLAREMFLFDPADFQLNHVALAENRLQRSEVSFVHDSDELFAVSLTEIGKDVGWHTRLRQATPMTIAPWWLRYDSKSNDFMAAQKIRWHFSEVTEKKWRAVETGCDLFIRRLAATREGIRVWQIAQSHACLEAGRVIAHMLNTGVFARALRGREAAIVFLPRDEAFASETNSRAGVEVDLNDNAELIRLVRKHHVPVPHEVVQVADPLVHMLGGKSCTQIETAGGPINLAIVGDGGLTVGNAKIVSKLTGTASIVIYLVDSLLR